MLPPPPPTDPDVQDYRIRFLTRELRAKRPKSAIHCRVVDRLWGPVSPPCFPSMVLHSRRLPSLGRVSMGSIPRPPAVLRRRYDSPLRMALALMVFASALHADLLVRASPKRSRPAGEAARARTVCSLGRPLCRVIRRVGEYGLSQVPWRSFPCLCQAPGPRSDPRWQAITPGRCCPRSEENEGSGV